MSAIIVCCDILASTTRVYISADRNVWIQSALRSFAIVCDYMKTALFATVCDPRSSAIIWKPVFKIYLL